MVAQAMPSAASIKRLDTCSDRTFEFGKTWPKIDNLVSFATVAGIQFTVGCSWVRV
jgi:hypothetical protein